MLPSKLALGFRENSKEPVSIELELKKISKKQPVDHHVSDRCFGNVPQLQPAFAKKLKLEDAIEPVSLKSETAKPAAKELKSSQNLDSAW